MKQIINYFCVSCLLMWFCFSCKTKYADKKDSTLYKKNNIDISVNYVICHESDSTSRLYYSIANTELTYKRVAVDSLFVADLELFCEIKPDLSSKIVLDTLTMFIKDKQPLVKQGLINGSRLLKIKNESEASLHLQLKDINRKAINETDISINKLSKLSAQNFIFKQQDSTVITDKYGNTARQILFRNNRVSVNYAYVSFAKLSATLPPPAFSMIEKKPDELVFKSTNKVQLNFEGWFPLSIEKQGVYFISIDSASPVGAVMYLFGGNFPKVTNHQQMIESIRFITSSEEYDKLTIATDKQKAIEDFWLGIGGSSLRAKQLIKNYYGRVQMANEQFSTFKEGWRTDRGMIYIIYGAPETIYRNENKETWIYGEAGSPFSTTFHFYKEENKLSENIYTLQRDVQFKNGWYLAVDAWREGRIYSDN